MVSLIQIYKELQEFKFLYHQETTDVENILNVDLFVQIEKRKKVGYKQLSRQERGSRLAEAKSVIYGTNCTHERKHS